MKLKIDTLYSQRDQQWSNILLGFNTAQPYTIGLYGCLITCISMYLKALGKNETPITVNDRTKALGADKGFSKGSGLYIWNALNLCWGDLTWDYVSPKYPDAVPDSALTKMKSLLDDGKPLLCEIDFNPATNAEEMHYVLTYGYDGDTFYACDPWTGTKIDLSVYGGVKRALISFKAFSLPLSKEGGDALATCMVDRTKFWKERDEEIAKNTDLTQKLTEVQATLDATKQDNKELKDNNKELVAELQELQDKCSSQSQQVISQEMRIGELTNNLNKQSVALSTAQNSIKLLTLQLESRPDSQVLTPATVLAKLKLWLKGK